VFENRVPKEIFGRKRDEVKREWRRLHNVELRDLRGGGKKNEGPHT
jgi:hypothetical protein